MEEENATINNHSEAGGAGGNETSEEIIEEHSLSAEPIFYIGNFTVTNSLFNSWLAVLIIIILALAIKLKIKTIPRGLQNYIEAAIETFLDFFNSITGSKEKSLKFFPLVFSFFVFIIISNWLGLLPGIGSVGQVVSEGEHKIFVPYLRGGTADLNSTLALAIIGVVASHIIGVMTIGAWHHLNKFINIKAFLEIPKKFKEDKMIILINPIKAVASLLEIIAEAAKVASLSFRLFGNVFAGEVLLASMSAILAFGLPLPFMFLEVLVGFVQALVFSLLILSYLTMATEKH